MKQLEPKVQDWLVVCPSPKSRGGPANLKRPSASDMLLCSFLSVPKQASSTQHAGIQPMSASACRAGAGMLGSACTGSANIGSKKTLLLSPSTTTETLGWPPGSLEQELEPVGEGFLSKQQLHKSRPYPASASSRCRTDMVGRCARVRMGASRLRLHRTRW